MTSTLNRQPRSLIPSRRRRHRYPTQALHRMLHQVVARPLFARAATDNLGSIRVLQKCGFKIIGTNKDFANGRGEETEEYILRLDLEQANA